MSLDKLREVRRFMEAGIDVGPAVWRDVLESAIAASVASTCAELRHDESCTWWFGWSCSCPGHAMTPREG